MKLKKVLAVLMASAMIMGMSVTTFAEPNVDSPVGNVTINGLAQEDTETVVNLYQAVAWDKEKSTWVVAEWAKPYIDTTKNPFKIKDEEGLSKAAAGIPMEQILSIGETSVVFNNVPVGAYVVLASGNNAVYSPMVVENYDEDATYMAAETNVTLTAKTSGYELTKEEKEGDNFIGRGEEVTFEVTTTFPMFENPASKDNTYKVIDTPTGLNIEGVDTITLGGETLKENIDYIVNEEPNIDGSTKTYTIDLKNKIGNTNENAGKRVVITYRAIVTSEDGYSNTANAFKNDSQMGKDEEEGWTGDITITKYDSDETTTLKGAEFEVYSGTKDEVEAGGGSPLSFVKISDGVYKLAMKGDSNSSSTIVTGEAGTVQVKGLDEGNYWFKETKAPDGYSINEDGVETEIDYGKDGATGDISISGKLTDTKLSSLPSTGGIGTTIFTIGGCVIMVTAAGLYFASRRKQDNK